MVGGRPKPSGDPVIGKPTPLKRGGRSSNAVVTSGVHLNPGDESRKSFRFGDDRGRGVPRTDRVIRRSEHRVIGRTNRLQYPSGPASCARLAKRVDFLMKASFTVPVGPLRCLAMMISALPSRSGSSCL